MDMYQLRALESAAGSLLSNGLSYIIAAVLSSVVLGYAIRWFIFQRAGEKGWKGLIPIYSDYILYKISWDGRIYIALLAVKIGAALVSALCGLIHPAFGMVMGVILNTVSMGAAAIVGLIVQFKLAHAFGRNDYFAVGLYFLGNVFSAILAFGSDVSYKGAQQDGIGVPGFIDRAGQRATSAAANAASRIARQAQQAVQQTPPQQPVAPQMQMPQQPVAPQMQMPQQPAAQQGAYYAQPPFQSQPMQQPYQAQSAQQPQPYGGYPMQVPTQTARRARYNPENNPNQ